MLDKICENSSVKRKYSPSPRLGTRILLRDGFLNSTLLTPKEWIKNTHSFTSGASKHFSILSRISAKKVHFGTKKNWPRSPSSLKMNSNRSWNRRYSPLFSQTFSTRSFVITPFVYLFFPLAHFSKYSRILSCKAPRCTVQNVGQARLDVMSLLRFVCIRIAFTDWTLRGCTGRVDR